MTETTSCGYQGFEFGATYPDSICINGFLWDADAVDDGMLTSGGEIPCLNCNTAARLDHLREGIQDILDHERSQIAVWEYQVRQIVEINETAALEALAAMPRHVFWTHKLAPRPAKWPSNEIVPDQSRTWPWPVPQLSAHQNIQIMRASSNPPGTDKEAPPN